MSNRPKIPILVKEQILIEAGHRCAVCCRTFPLEIAHIVPWHKSKEHRADDLLCMCANCHTEADTRKWNERVFRQYKKNPCVFRIAGVNQDAAKPTSQVKIEFEEDIADLSQSRIRCIEAAIAAFLDIAPDCVRIVIIEKGSVKLTVQVPEVNATKLAQANLDRDERLMMFLDTVNTINVVELFNVPDRFCDVVMKGGITSGVVYPLAVARLAERFKLKNIGGTSAGAIAAAAAAAAELGRNAGGFDQLKELPGFLSGLSPDGKNTNLFAFFQPQPKTRALFNVAVSALGGGPTAILRILRTALMEFPLAVFLGSLPALCLFVSAWLSAVGLFFFVCLLASFALLAIGVLTILALFVAMRVSSTLPKNFYGLCTGMTEAFFDTDKSPPPSQGKPLTFWLMEYLNQTAGRKVEDNPLTFGDLWGTKDPNAERVINLEMMTTCVTHGRPYRLPFRDDEDLNENRFYFCREEFERLFPKRVVDWLLAHPRDVSGISEKERTEALVHRNELAEHGIHPMPAPADLPLVVAVRMSLSFPILLSAVPLYAIERRRDPDGKHPERCWFSDGGVCSNFPLHFFDSALPRRPTLSINLSEKPNGTPGKELVPEMVESNQAGSQERWNRFEIEETVEAGTLVGREKSGFGKIGGFVGSLIKTMQNWTDNTQSRLPGFRDRIVHVPLTPKEGGLNLNMSKPRIDSLTNRGEEAGQKLLDRFDDPPRHPLMTWNNHRWLRMRSLMASLEKTLGQIDTACERPEGGDDAYDKWIVSGSKPPSYPWENQEQRHLAIRTLSIMRRVARAWQRAKTSKGKTVSAANGAPRPRAELRPRAQI